MDAYIPFRGNIDTTSLHQHLHCEPVSKSLVVHAKPAVKDEVRWQTLWMSNSINNICARASPPSCLQKPLVCHSESNCLFLDQKFGLKICVRHAPILYNAVTMDTISICCVWERSTQGGWLCSLWGFAPVWLSSRGMKVGSAPRGLGSAFAEVEGQLWSWGLQLKLVKWR